MAFRLRMSKLGGRKSKRNHESQVEQKFEWSRDAVKLVWIAPAHPPGVMMQGVGTGRHRVYSCAICWEQSTSFIEKQGLGAVRLLPFQHQECHH